MPPPARPSGPVTPPSARRLALLANHGSMGGGEVMLVRLARAALASGVDTVVVGPAGSDLADAAGHHGLAFEPLAARDGAAYGRALVRWAARRRDAVLWCNGGTAALAAAAARSTAVVHLHQHPTPSQALALWPARARAAATLVPSPYLQAHVPGSLVFENWTDAPASPVPPAAPAQGPGGALRVGYLGRLSTRKGVDVLARAVADLGRRHGVDARLVVAGDARFVTGAEAARVDGALHALGGRVERLGWVPGAELFASVDVVAVPSVWPESFGLVAAEAMGHGVAVVASRAGALPDVVGHDHPGLVAAGDSAALADALAASQAGAGAATPSVVAEGRARWQRRFSPEAGRARLAGVLALLGLTDPAA